MEKFDYSIVGTHGLPPKYGGFETLAHNLTLNLTHKSFIIYCSKFNHNNKSSDKLGNNIYRYFIPLKANGWQAIPYDWISIFHAMNHSKQVLILGTTGCTALPFLRMIFPMVNVITHIDGIEWKREKWGLISKVIYYISERVAISFSDFVVSDNLGINDYLRKSYGKRYLKRVINLSYGGTNIIKRNSNKSDQNNVKVVDSRNNKEINLIKRTYFLKIARIEKENNIQAVINAYLQSKKKLKKLVIVGNWKKTNFGRQLLKKYSLDKNKKVILAKPIYNEIKLSIIRRNAYAYIHGHSAGGTNPSLIEAISDRLPVMAYNVDFNRYSLFNKGLMWSNSNDLSHILDTLDDETCKKISQDLTKIYNQNYNWEKICSSYEDKFNLLSLKNKTFYDIFFERLKNRILKAKVLSS